MNAFSPFCTVWHQHVKEFFSGLHGHQRKTLALFVLGAIRAERIVLPRVAEALLSEREAKAPSIERRLERFLSHEKIETEETCGKGGLYDHWRECVWMFSDGELVCEIWVAFPLSHLWRASLRALVSQRPNQPTCPVSDLVSEPGKRFYGPIRLWQEEQIETNLSAYWDKQEEKALLVISDLPAGPKRISDYKLRGLVEATFQDLKSRGWDWEESHVRRLDRVDRMLLVRLPDGVVARSSGCFLYSSWSPRSL